MINFLQLDLHIPIKSFKGYLIGHNDGITHIDSRKDGRYVISNSKDQTVKLWDLRKLHTNPHIIRQAQNHTNPGRIKLDWDYRGYECTDILHLNIKCRSIYYILRFLGFPCSFWCINPYLMAKFHLYSLIIPMMVFCFIAIALR